MWGARCTLGPHQPSQISWINGKSLWQRLGPFSVSDRSHSWLSARLGRMHCRRARVDGPAAQIDRGCGVRDGRQEQALGGRPSRSVPGRVRAGADWCRRRNGGSRSTHKGPALASCSSARSPSIARTTSVPKPRPALTVKCPLTAALTVPLPRVSTRPQPSRAASLAKRAA